MSALVSHQWAPENIATTFYKCTRWLVEENNDLPNCHYHYFCDSVYLGNYPPIIDFLVFTFTISSYLLVLYLTLLNFTTSNVYIGISKKRYLLPSGPIAFPLILVILSKGLRINTLFPLTIMGPALNHIVHISALAFEYQTTERSVKYVVLEASTVSGIIHASLYLDSIIMPYYTGLDAMMESTFSGDCATCVCRTKVLVVGGGINYRGWSNATMGVVFTIFLRMMSRAVGEDKLNLVTKVKSLFEGLSWILITSDVFYLMITVPGEDVILDAMAYGGICALVLLHVFRKVHLLWVKVLKRFQVKQRASLCHDIV